MMGRFAGLIVSIAGLALSLAAPATVKAFQVVNPDVAAIVREWQAQAGRIRTVRIHWTIERLDRQGSLEAFAAPATGVESRPFPPEDTSYEIRHELLYDATRVRHYAVGQMWNLETGALAPYEKTSGCDARTTHSLQGVNSPNGVSVGAISDLDWFAPLMSSDNAPIGMFLNTFDARWSTMKPSDLKRAAARDRTDGVLCLSSGEGVRYYVGARAPFSILERNLDALRNKLEIEWAPHPVVGSAPVRWTSTTLSPEGAILTVLSGQVTTCEINVDLPPAALDLVFPAGIQVLDMRYMSQSVAEVGGGLRPAGRIGAPIADSHQRRWLGWLFWGGALAIVVILTWRQRNVRHPMVGKG